MAIRPSGSQKEKVEQTMAMEPWFFGSLALWQDGHAKTTCGLCVDLYSIRKITMVFSDCAESSSSSHTPRHCYEW